MTVKTLINLNFSYGIENEDIKIINGYLSEVEKKSTGAYHGQKSVILQTLDFIRKPLKEISMLDIKEYFERDLDLQDIQMNTKETRRSYLKSFFFYVQSVLLNEGVVFNNPVPINKVFSFTKRRADYKKVSEQEEDVFTEDEIQDLLEKAKLQHFRDFILFGIIASTGMRISECLTIRVENINLEERYIETGFEKDARKSDKALLFFIPEGFVPFLENYLLVLGKKTGWLFPGRSTNHFTYGGWRPQVLRYYGEKYSLFHAFRRSKITHQIKMGCPLLISEMLMNHAPSSVEGKHYLKLSIQEKRAYFDKYFPYKNILFY